MEFYNQERKERYIKLRQIEVTMTGTYLTRIFKNSKPYEEKYGKDICNFTTPEIEDMLKTQSTSSVSTLIGDVYQYATYTDWCLSQGFVHDSQNHFREIDVQNSGKYLNRALRKARVITPSDIKKWEIRLNNVSDKALVWLYFYGLSYREILALRGRDIEREKYIIHTCTGKKVVVDYHITELMFESIKEDKYYAIVGDQRVTKPYLRIQDNGDQVIRTTVMSTKDNVSEPQQERRLYNRLRSIFRELGVSMMNPASLQKSGFVWQSKEIMKQKGMALEEYAGSSERRELAAQYNKKSMSRSKFLLEYREFFEE